MRKLSFPILIGSIYFLSLEDFAAKQPLVNVRFYVVIKVFTEIEIACEKYKTGTTAKLGQLYRS